MRNGRRKVLLIGGAGRTGSTLLERVIAQAPGVVSVGEIRHLWKRGVSEDQLCGCGRTFAECDFWSRVMATAFPGESRPDPGRMLELRHVVDRVRRIPAQAIPWLRTRAYNKEYQEYTSHLRRLYDAIADVAQADLIVDSSKDVSYGYLLASMPEIDLRLLVLARDPRAVTYSWLRKKSRPEIYWRKVEMEIKHPLRTALDYDICYAFYEVLARRVAHSIFLRYEDFIRDPWSTMDAIGEFASLPSITASLVANDKSVWLNPYHSVAGNPNRFQTGSATLDLDDVWEAAIPNGAFRASTLATLVFLLRNHYPVFRRGHGDGETISISPETGEHGRSDG